MVTCVFVHSAFVTLDYFYWTIGYSGQVFVTVLLYGFWDYFGIYGPDCVLLRKGFFRILLILYIAFNWKLRGKTTN
jgi:hypothetical protein